MKDLSTKVDVYIDGKYEILKEIGRGGMSVVYLARDNRLNKQWAIKEIKLGGTDQKSVIIGNSSEVEINMMKKLDHPALPRIVDIINNGDLMYVVMDFIEGRSMDKVLLEEGPQPEDVVMDWAKQLSEALHYLHSQKPPIIYRDMKPANIMLKPEGTIKVIDFGIAREVKDNSGDTAVLGTPGYAPPEQYQGKSDIRSDIYALGMTLHHLLTGENPRFAGYEYFPVRSWNPSLSEGIESIINKCVATSPNDRYQNCAELLYDLEHPHVKTQEFKKIQKRKLGAFVVSVALCVLSLISHFVAGAIDDQSYENLLLQSSVESYIEAVENRPTDTRAYLQILDYYESAGVFGEDEASVYNSLFDVSNFDKKSMEYAELNYESGRMFFIYYTGGDSSTLRNRIFQASYYFSLNHNNADLSEEFKNSDIGILSESYYQLCYIYIQFLFNDVSVDEAGKSDYDELISSINASIDIFEENSSIGEFDKISYYNSAYALIYDRRVAFANTGVEETEVLALMTRIETAATSISAEKERTVTLRDEILNNADVYRNAVEAAYDAVERS